MAKTLSAFKKVQELRDRYYKAAQGKDALLKLIMAAEIPEQVYNSNAIENSTLTLEETEKLLLQIEIDRFISEREIFEAKNLARVVEYTDKKAKEQELTIDVILLMHKMLISNIRDDIAGRLRKIDEFVRVGSYIAPSPTDVPKLLEDALITYNAENHEHIVKRVAKLHLNFEHAHPFVDGNGRIGRAINNYMLIREGYVPINIKFIDRRLYYDAFKEYDQEGKTEIMEEIIAKALTNSYHKRLAYLEDKQIVSLSKYAKLTKQSHSNLHNKANRQTIGAFFEKGDWKIGMDRN